MEHAIHMLLDPKMSYGDNSRSITIWYSALSAEEKRLVREYSRSIIDFTLWRFLFAFSDQSVGKIRADGGMLELYYRSADGKRTVISGDPEESFQMHDIYPSGPDFPAWILSE